MHGIKSFWLVQVDSPYSTSVKFCSHIGYRIVAISAPAVSEDVCIYIYIYIFENVSLSLERLERVENYTLFNTDKTKPI